MAYSPPYTPPSQQHPHPFTPPRTTSGMYRNLSQSSPRPFFFISRNTGVAVALVPADELPFNIRLQGIPRVLRLEETMGMQHVGSAYWTGQTYKLEPEIHANGGGSPPVGGVRDQRPQPLPGSYNGHSRNQSSTGSRYFAPDALARQALQQSAANAAAQANTHAPPAHETATSWRSKLNPAPAPEPTPASNPTTSTSSTSTRTQALIDAIVNTTSGAAQAAQMNYVSKSALPPPPSGQLPDQDKKQYCTYWIRTGECDYTQQGCLYKHEMPDRETLERIGFRGVPRWWSERQGRLGGSAAPGEKERREAEERKTSAWLRRLKGARATRDEGGEGSGSEEVVADDGTSLYSGRSSDEEKKQEVAKKDEGAKQSTILKKRVTRPPTPQPVQERSIAQPALKPTKARAEPAKGTQVTPTKPVTTPVLEATGPTQPRPVPAIDVRKLSACSDLIDLAGPPPPTPTPSPARTPSLSPVSSASSSPRLASPGMPATPPTPSTPTQVSFEPWAQIFVPQGETAEEHIVEVMRKREKRSGPESGGGAKKGGVHQGKAEQGLMASRHGPQAAVDGEVRGRGEKRAGYGSSSKRGKRGARGWERWPSGDFCCA